MAENVLEAGRKSQEELGSAPVMNKAKTPKH